MGYVGVSAGVSPSDRTAARQHVIMSSLIMIQRAPSARMLREQRCCSVTAEEACCQRFCQPPGICNEIQRDSNCRSFLSTFRHLGKLHPTSVCIRTQQHQWGGIIRKPFTLRRDGYAMCFEPQSSYCHNDLP